VHGDAFEDEDATMKTADDAPIEGLALRLLRLEQRFQSYCALHDEELREIREALRHLREDLLAQASLNAGRPLLHSDEDEEGAGHEEEDVPISAL
jgi:hypothetical protein